MASALQKVARAAGRLFANYAVNQPSVEKTNNLLEKMRIMSCDDILFDRIHLQAVGKYRWELGTAPVMYVPLWEDEKFTMGVFILKHGVRIPLHDHPNMHGFIKVVHGKALIESYSTYDHASIPQSELAKLESLKPDLRLKCVERLPDKIVQPKDGVCCLTPNEANIHEIWALDGPMAFLDILAPPYDHDTGSRECHYYKDIKGISEDVHNTSYKYLLETDQPADFWCGTVDYLGEELNPYSDT